MFAKESRHNATRCRVSLAHCVAALALVFIQDVASAQIRASDVEESSTAQATFDPNLGLVLVPVVIGGTQAEFMLASALPGLVVDRSLRGLLTPLPPERDGGSAPSVHKRKLFSPAEPLLILGEATKVGSVRCADYFRLSASLGARIDGAVGMDCLRSHVVRVDFDQGICAFFKHVPRDAGVPVPLRDASGVPVVDVSFDDGADTVPFTINTANCGTDGNLKEALVARLAERGLARRVNLTYGTTIGGTRKCTNFRVSKMTLGCFTHSGTMFTSSEANVLGADFLSRYTVTFDFPGKTMYLKPGSRFNEPSLHDLSGARVYRPGRKTRIRFVDAGSPAEAAGLKADDVLERIDAQPAASLTVQQIQKMLCVAGEHTLEVMRSREPVVFRLSLQDLEGGQMKTRRADEGKADEDTHTLRQPLRGR